MTLKLTVKVDVGNLSICDIFQVLSNYGKDRLKDGIMNFDGFDFYVKSEPTSTGINYVINEIREAK